MLIKYPLDQRYDDYLNDDDQDNFPTKGNYTVHGLDVVQTTDEGAVLFTQAGSYTRTAKLTNEAGEGTKDYKHTIVRVNANKVKAWQAEESASLLRFFDGYIDNSDNRFGEEFGGEILVRENEQPIKYTGDVAKLLDGVKGAKFGSYTQWGSVDMPIYVKGLGVPTLWYVGVDGTSYPLTSNVPTKVGTYKIYASFTQGDNFEAVPASETSIVYIGTIIVEPGDIVSVFGKIDNDSYKKFVVLQGKTARSNIKVGLPNLARYGAEYNLDNLSWSASSGGDAALETSSIKFIPTLSQDTLTFNVNDQSNYGDYIEFRAEIVNNIDNPNLVDGLYITIRVDFVMPEEMKEAKPQIIVNYKNEVLTGFVSGTSYTINGEAVTAVNSAVAVNEAWKGNTVSIVALPTLDGKYASDAQTLKVGNAVEISEELRAVKGDSASTNASTDGRLNGTTTKMEYKLASAADTAWKAAGNVVTTGLKAGTYSVRIAASDTSFPSQSVTVAIYAKTISVTEVAREIPNKDVATEAAVAPVAKSVAGLTVGPSPVASNAQAKIFWNGSKSVKGTLGVFNNTGKKVASVKVSGTKQVGVWNVNNAATGTYLLKGTLSSDGAKVKVTIPVAVVR